MAIQRHQLPDDRDSKDRGGYVVVPMIAVVIPVIALAMVLQFPCVSQDSALQIDELTTDTNPDAADEDIRFEAYDVVIDSGDHVLAAWQCELLDPSGRVSIVGIEGGEHAAFAEPPHYDPAAMANDRVILAAYSTGSELPSGRSRVARVNIRVRGQGDVDFSQMLRVAADSDGESIPAELSVGKVVL